MATPLKATSSSTELKRQIGLYAATAITVGNIIGSGIFRSPHSVAQELPGFTPVMLAWIVGGILSICGSLVLTEVKVAERAPILKAWCQFATSGRQHLPVSHDAPISAFEAIAGNYPVFRIDRAAAA